MADVSFHGGPLAGQHYAPSVAAAVADTFNHTYAPDHYDLGAGGDYYFSTVVGGGSTSATPPISGKQAGRAWHKLTKVLSSESAHAYRSSKAARKRMLRVVK